MLTTNKPPVQAEPKPKMFGQQPPTPSGLRRLAPWMGMLAGGGVVAAVGFYALQVVMPEQYRPAVVAGQAAGDAIRAEIDRMKESKIDLARREADATTQPQIKGQVDAAVANGVLQERTASLAPMTEAAGVADLVCAGAKILSLFTEPQGWGHQSSDDFYTMAQKTGAATCGMGNAIRQGVTANMLDAVQTATAARGMSMNNGALAVTGAASRPAPVPVAAPPRALPGNLAEVYAIATPSRHWPWPIVMKAREFIKTLPQETQDRLFADLNEDTGWDVLVDRVAAYQLVPDAPLATAPVPGAPVKVTTATPVAPSKPVPPMDNAATRATHKG